MKKKIALLLALVLAVGLFMKRASYYEATSFSSITSASIQEKESQIDKAQEERKALQDSLAQAKELKAQLEQQKKDLRNYVAELDSQLQTIEENILQLNARIEEKEAEIAETQAELQKAREKEQEQYEAMVARIQRLYELGDTGYLDMIFSSSSMGDMLNSLVYMEQITAYDNQQLEEFMLNRQYIEICEEELLQEKALLDEAKEVILEEEALIQEMIADKEATIRAYDADISNKSNAIAEYEADIKEQNEIIEALEAAIAAERKRILEQNGTVLNYDGGIFKFPLASYTRISDEYGPRIHPTLGVQQFHNGVDFASPAGTAIYAAYDGVVVAATYSSTMGNYVMIDHGSNLYTIYMHASKLYVSKDDVVSRGTTIAAVGSTGRSTGPHLHFSVRLNGEYVSPWNYLSQ
ncbi:MAG: peptidoglycan DD-metalloendopeptidase family protein [Lachnospiraceae bacterium]|nr:peptidoglycan DD-metalloendopeptidase family protein [Lachnospiraceae bacterium]